MTFTQILRRRSSKALKTSLVKHHTIYDVIHKPVMTEKSFALSPLNKYVFRVHMKANKNDVKLAIKELFGVDPIAVNMLITPYKWRSSRKLVRRAYKKAIVTLDSQSKIDLW